MCTPDAVLRDVIFLPLPPFPDNPDKGIKKFTHNAPCGVTLIQLDNGDEALYLHGECPVCVDFSERVDSVCGIGERLAEKLGIPSRLLELSVPDDEE